MATPTTVDRIAKALQTIYPEKIIRKHKMDQQPFWAYITKKDNFYGKNASFPTQVSIGGRGNSHTFDDAQEDAGGGDYEEWQYTRKKDYKIITFDNEALEASEGDPGGYVSVKKLEVEGALDYLVQRLGADLHSADGNCGTVNAVSAVNNTIDIGQTDVVGLEKGARIQAAASTFTALRAGGPKGYMVIDSIDLDTPGNGFARITLDIVNGDSVTQYGVVATDRIYPKGNFGKGLDSTEKWVPTDRSNLSVAFNNVVRSSYPSRLAGIFFDMSGYGLAEGFERGLARAKLEGVTVDTIWLSPNRFTDMSLDAGSRVMRESFKIGEWGFDSLKMNSPGGKGGTVRFISDPNIKDTTALGTTKETWRFHSLNGAPRNLTRRAGSEMLVEPARDGFQQRYGYYGNLVCLDPGQNIRFTLPV